MRIDRILTQSRRDFRAIYVCESCGHTEEGSGYDDRYFHEVVIPAMTCKKCGKVAPPDYRPLTTKYPEGVQV